MCFGSFLKNPVITSGKMREQLQSSSAISLFLSCASEATQDLVLGCPQNVSVIHVRVAVLCEKMLWFRGVCEAAGLMVGIDELKGLFQA